MASTVCHTCRNYFEGFQDLSTFNANNSCKNALGMLKVVSYFTILVPLFVGLTYGVFSLIGRVSVGDRHSPISQKASSICRKVFGKSFEGQLEQFFKSPTKFFHHRWH